MEIFTVAFFGHRYIENLFKIEELLEVYVLRLLKENEYVEFLVGRNGEFDQCVAKIVRKVKREYRDDNSSLVLVLPYPTAEYVNNEKNFKTYYDDIEISENAFKAHPKSAIQIRNREMVERAELIICCLEENYGGVYQTIKYAKKRNKKILNLVLQLKQ